MALKVNPITNTSLPMVSLKPKLIWIWTAPGESSCLWPRNEIAKSEFDDPAWEPIASEEFFDAVAQASERLWILDPYFEDKVGLASIWLALTGGVKDIRVISHEKKPVEWIKARQAKDPIVPAIQWKNGFQELHDRFAIVDDEVWHFGSTVGGGYTRFGAASRGWSADDLSVVFQSRWGSSI